MKCQILNNVKFRGSSPWRQVAAVVKFWNELRMSCDCQISAELSWAANELRIAAAVKFHVDELQIELQNLTQLSFTFTFPLLL